MKKIFNLFIISICLFLLISCVEFDTEKEKELKAFFNSHSIDVTYKFKNQYYEADVFQLVSTKNALSFKFTEENYYGKNHSFILDKDSNLFYDLGAKIAYVKLDNTELSFNTNVNLDMDNYIYYVKEDGNNLVFDFKMGDFLRDTNTNFAGYIPYKNFVVFKAVFENNKITELSYEVENRTVIIQINYYCYDNSSSNEFNEIKLPNISDCVHLTKDELRYHIRVGASGDIDNYEFVVSRHDFTVIKGNVSFTYFSGYIYDKTNSKTLENIYIEDVFYNEEEIPTSKNEMLTLSTSFLDRTFNAQIQPTIITEEDFKNFKLVISLEDFVVKNGKLSVSFVDGYIYDTVNSKKIENVFLKDIYYNEEEILSSEDNTLTVFTEYYGTTFTTKVEFLSIFDIKVESKTILDSLTKVTYGFSVDDNVYLCDDRYLYKFDELCNELIDKIDLQCIGKSHYIKDDYIYITSYFPYDTTYNPSDSYTGNITQIRLSDFTVEKQVKVNCLPNSIIVDNRNNVIISKGANQHVYIDQVDMETGKLTPLIKSYQKDELLYDSYNDTITVVTSGHTGDNDLYKYDGKNWVYVGDSSIQGEILYFASQELIIFSNGIYRYDSITNDYINEKFEYKQKNYKNLFNTKYVVIDDQYAYIFEEEYRSKLNCLLVYNLNTKKYDRYFISEEYKLNIIFMYQLAEDIYFIDTNGIFYKIII